MTYWRLSTLVTIVIAWLSGIFIRTAIESLYYRQIQDTVVESMVGIVFLLISFVASVEEK